VTRRQSLLEAEWAGQPTASDAACVEAIAARLLQQCGVDEPPVDVELIASALGIGEIDYDIGMVESGCLIPQQGRLRVRLRATDPRVRQRFTLCHEGSHTFFPGFDRTARFRCSPTSAPGTVRRRGISSPARTAPTGAGLEALCDLGASALLLPRRLFTDDARSLAPTMDSVEQLAGRYDASLEATARRFVADRPRGETFVVLKLMTKKRDRAGAAPQLRVASPSTSALTGWIPQYKSAAPNGPFGRALQGEIVDETAWIDDLLPVPRRLRISARPYPYTDNHGLRVERVLALLSSPTP